MRALGIIAITSLLVASAARADEVNGKALVEQLFADCDAVLVDPSHALTMGDLQNAAPASATVDGKFFSVTVPLEKQYPSLSGVAFFTATTLPKGLSANCSVSLFSSSLSKEVADQITAEATARGQALIGKDAVQIGGLIGGPAVIKALTEGSSHVYTWATPDFPPTAVVSVTAAPQFSSITIHRYKAAP